MNRCQRCNAALPRNATRCPRCGTAPRSDKTLMLSDADLVEMKVPAPEERSSYAGDHNLQAKQPDPPQGYSAAFTSTREEALELAAVLPSEERAKKKPIEKKEDPEEKKKEKKRGKEIEKAAGYGSPPQGLGDAALYALWFVWRQIALRQTLKNFARKRETEQSRLDAAYRAAGQALHDRRRDAALTACGQELRAIAEIQAKVRMAVEQDERVKQSASQEVEYVVDSISHTQKNTEPFRIKEEQLLAELKRREEERAKIETEIRSVEELYKDLRESGEREPDAGGSDGVEEALRARKDKLADLVEQIDGLNIDLEEVRIELGDATKKVGELHQQRKSTIAERTESAQRREALRRRAEEELAIAMQALGRRGYADIPDAIPAPRAEAIRKAAGNLNATDKKIELHQRAMASYDRDGLVRGSLVVAGLVALLITLMAAFSILFDSSRVVEEPLLPPPPTSAPSR